MRGGKAALKAAKSGAKKAAQTKAGKKVIGAAKKTAEGVGYAATPGLKRGARGAYTRAGRRGFIGKGAVQKTGAKVIGGGAAIGTGAAGAKVVSSKSNKKAAAPKPAPKPAPAKPGKAPIKFGVKTSKPAPKPAPKAVKKPIKKAVKKAAPRGASSAGSRFDRMTTSQKNRLRGRDAAAYRKYLKSKKK